MAAYVVRTETDGKALLAKLRGGSARIGWSYRDDLDLQSIIKATSDGLFDRLDGEQKDAWYCHGFVDVARIDDLLFYPNVPDYGLFCIVRIINGYTLLQADDGIEGDFRSARPCELITSEPINKLDAIVPSVIRHKLGLQRRFYQLNAELSDIDFLLQNIPNRSIAGATHSLSFSRMMDTANRDLGRQWSRFFPAANLSKFLAELLERHGQRVDLREGPSEKGTDLVVEVQNEFLDRPVVIGIQVGSYQGNVYPAAVNDKLSQLLSGWNHNSLDYGALVLTGDWTAEAKKVVEDHNRENPTRRVKWIDGRQLAQIVTRTTWVEKS